MDDLAPHEQATAESTIPAHEEGMGDLLEQHGSGPQGMRRGDVVEGVVVSVGKDELLVDIGGKSEGLIPIHEAGLTPGAAVSVKVGDQVLAYVLQPEDAEGHTVLSIARAQVERGWRSLQRYAEEGTVLEAEVLEHNRGGLIVNSEGVRGFVPISQIADLRQGAGREEPIEERLESMKGRRLLLKVIEVNRRRNRLILSERQAMKEKRDREKERLLSELQPGDVRHGRVSSVCDFGAFVDLGGADGLIHVSELSWSHLSHPNQLLKVDDEVDVYVVSVDVEKKKIALSLKRLLEEPWARVSEKYPEGSIVTGRITKLANFGAFAQIEDGIEGLIHISELSNEHIAHPRSVVREGDLRKLVVVRIDPERRRLGLSLKRVEGQDGAEEEQSQLGGMAERPDLTIGALSGGKISLEDMISQGEPEGESPEANGTAGADRGRDEDAMTEAAAAVLENVNWAAAKEGVGLEKREDSASSDTLEGEAEAAATPYVGS